MFSKLFVATTSATLFSFGNCNQHEQEHEHEHEQFHEHQEEQEQEQVFQSSCRELSNGDYTLKLMDGDLQDAPLVNVQCNNGYTILDVSKDNDLTEYFDTFMNFHHGAAGPSNDIHTNWEGWYIPDDGSTEYVISPDCNTCDYDNQRQLYESPSNGLKKTAYMMTGTLFGCFWNLKGEHNFDQDYESYQCYYTTGEVNDVGESIRSELTDESSTEDWNESGVCAFSVRESDRVLPSPMTHDACTVDFWSLDHDRSEVYHLKPSLGTEGQFCVCVKPISNNYYTLDSNDVALHLNGKKERELNKLQESSSLKLTPLNDEDNDNDDNEASSATDMIYELYQSDFETGTYRILESGTYKIMENIVFDFNADYENPNSGTAWWPHIEQNDKYAGAGDYHDAYFLGFFAGITIEADNVILDLNGYELKMSDVFFHQQRWFTIISLQSQYFLPGQGIGFFGSSPKFGNNVEIKNGILGLTSHHGIHGHFNKNILIENVQIKEFETHGIQFNGFNGITIKNVEIGPTAEKSYFKGEYGHARTLLPRFQKIADMYPNEELLFYGRTESVTMQDIVDELQKQTDMAYYYVTEGREYDDDDESWISAKNLFIDKSAYPNGAAMYGIFLNTYGASVLTYNLYTSFYSTDATVENVKIHGLRHSMTEYIRMSIPQSGNLYMNPLHAPFDATQILESVSDFTSPRYKGSILTDACLAMEKLSDDWNLLQASLIVDNKLLDWAFGDNLDGMNDVQIGCNTDAMIHSGKGINGLRIDGVDGISINNIEIYDIVEYTPLGRTECGQYSDFDGGSCTGACGGHFRQTAPMQIGFSGNMVQGININAAKNVILKDINVYNLESKNGEVYGISIWPAVHAKFEGNIDVKYLQAGSDIEKGRLMKKYRPNSAPEVCGVRVYSSYTSNDFEYRASVNTHDADSINTQCIDGHTMCLGSSSAKASVGTYDDDDNESCDWTQYVNNDIDDKESSGIGISSNSGSVKSYAIGKNGNNNKGGDNGDSTRTTNDTYSKTFNTNMIYLLVFLTISFIAIIGGKFLKQWFPVVDYMIEKRFEQSNNRLSYSNNNNNIGYGTV